jgi:hypothetical protein
MVLTSDFQKFGKLSIEEKPILEGSNGISKEGRDGISSFPDKTLGPPIKPEAVHESDDPFHHLCISAFAAGSLKLRH